MPSLEASTPAQSARLPRYNDDLCSRLARMREELAHTPNRDGRMAVRSKGRIVFVNTASIEWIGAADNYVSIHCGAETFSVRGTMNWLERQLDQNRFLRIHRCTIVNVERIKELQPWFRGDYLVILQNGPELKMSRGYRDRLRDRFAVSA